MAPRSPEGHYEEICDLDGGGGDDSELGAEHARGCVPPWREQLTARGMVASLAVGAMYSVIVMKLVLTTGLVPTLNVSAALIAFVVLRGWTKALARLGVVARPFRRQENTVVHAAGDGAAVPRLRASAACSSIFFACAHCMEPGVKKG